MAEDASPILLRRRVIAAKAETTTGVAQTLAAADAAMNIYNPEMTSDIEVSERELQGNFAYGVSTLGPYLSRLTFESDLAGSGTTGVPLWADTLLPACGMTKASSTFTFGIQETLKTLTIGYYEGGLLRSMAGAVGTFTIPFLSGRAARIRWEFLGVEQPDADVAMLSPTLPTVQPPRWANAGAVAFGAFAPVLSRLEVAAGNELVAREDANQAITGVRSGLIVDRKARATGDPETTLVAGRAWQSIFRAGTTEALSVVLGTVANNIVTIAAPTGQVIARPRGDRNKISVENVTLALLGNAPFSIAFS